MLEIFVRMYTTVTMLPDRAREEKGATATEYGLLVAFIALAIIVGVTAFGTALNDFFNAIANTVDGWA